MLRIATLVMVWFVASLAWVSAANAGCTTQNIGSFAYTNCDDGTNITSQRLGNFTYHSFSDGTSGTTQRLGNFDYHNFGDRSGTTQRLGNFDYHSGPLFGQ